MSPDRLGTALRDLVVDVEDGLAPPGAADLWAVGRRRRRSAQVVPLLAAACIAALVALLVWPSGLPRASVPAVQPDGTQRLTSYPSAIPKPPFMTTTTAPGVTAAVLTEGFDSGRTFAVSPTGSVTHLVLPDAGSALGPPALSPDGRWLARGAQLHDLVRGVALPSPPAGTETSSTRSLGGALARWSPDSRRVYVDAIDEGEVGSNGVVIGTDGSVTDLPLLGGMRPPIVAGWLNGDTLLGVLVNAERTSLPLVTWTPGQSGWVARGGAVEWEVDESDNVRASLSTEGNRLLVSGSRLTEGSRGDDVETTAAMMFDPVTGAQLGMPVGDEGELRPGSAGSFVRWEGWGCQPAWRNNLPVITDGSVRGFVDTDPSGVIDGSVDTELVAISGRYAEPCVAFAGDELRGTPVADMSAVWKERLYGWGVPALIVGLIAGCALLARRLRR